MFRKTGILLGLAMLAAYAPAQETGGETIERIIADIFEQRSENSETELDFSDFYADMMSCAENPINLNNTTKEELDKLQFLSDTQIDNILYYLYRYAPIQSIYELQLIDGLEMTDIRLLLPFVTVGSNVPREEALKLTTILTRGGHEVFLRSGRGLETKEGYRLSPATDEKGADENRRKYIGSSLYNHLKYRFRYRNKVAFGITGEKDAGEPFWNSRSKGYDFYSAHVEFKNLGKLKTLVLGDYRANFGLGLVMRTDFSMGKSGYVLQVNPRASGLRKFTGTDEYNFFRGAAATVGVGKKTDISAFYSNNKLDGDTTGGQFGAIRKDGLHRTFDELNRKHSIGRQVVGGNVTITYPEFQLGATVVYTAFALPLVPEPAKYNRFYFRGKSQLAGSVNYRMRAGKLLLSGETAHSDRHGGWATTNDVRINPAPNISLVTLYRYFSKEYDPLFGVTFSESSRVNNESGFYLGVEARPIKYWKLSAYADSYRFPWLKSGIDAPSEGKDFLVQADYVPRQSVKMYWRFKFEQKAANISSDTASVVPMVLPRAQWSARYRLDYGFGEFQFKNQLDVNGFSDGISSPTYGFSALQDVGYTFRRIPLGFNVRFHIFDAPHFANRMYIYENDILYAFSIPMIYGIGTRYYVNLRYTPSRFLTVWLKLAQTAYADDRTTIGTYNEAIQGHRKTDLKLQIRLRW